MALLGVGIVGVGGLFPAVDLPALLPGLRPPTDGVLGVFGGGGADEETLVLEEEALTATAAAPFLPPALLPPLAPELLPRDEDEDDDDAAGRDSTPALPGSKGRPRAPPCTTPRPPDPLGAQLRQYQTSSSGSSPSVRPTQTKWYQALHPPSQPIIGDPSSGRLHAGHIQI